jgi:hypothetical protein
LIAGHVIDTEICATGLPNDTRRPEEKLKLADEDEFIGDSPVLDVPETTPPAKVGNANDLESQSLLVVKSASFPYQILSRKPNERLHEKELKQSATPKVIVSSIRFVVRFNSCEVAYVGGPPYAKELEITTFGNTYCPLASDPRKPDVKNDEFSYQSSACMFTKMDVIWSGKQLRSAQQYHPPQHPQFSASLPSLRMIALFLVASGIRCRPWWRS